jgi:hypothetical protein
MDTVTTIPQATKKLVASINGASQRLHEVATKVAGIFGIEAPTAPVEASDLHQAMGGFIVGSLATAEVFDEVAVMFDDFLGEPEPTPEPVQIEQAQPQVAEVHEPAPETMTTPGEVEDHDHFCEQEESIAEKLEQSNANMSTAEPDFLPDADPVNRMATYSTEPSSNGTQGGRATKGRKRKGG